MKERDEPKMTAQVWDKAPVSYWDHFLDHRETHVYSISIEGGEPKAHHARLGRRARRRRAGRRIPTTSRPTAPRSRSPPTSIAAASIRTSTSSCCRSTAARAAQPHGDNPARRYRAEVQPRRPAARISAPGDQGLLRRPHAPDAVRASRRQGPQSDRRLGSLRRTASCGRPTRTRCSARSTTPARAASIASTSAAARRAPVTREHSFSSLAIAGSGPVIVGLRQSFIEPPTLVSIIRAHRRGDQAVRLQRRRARELTQGRVESVTYKGANGDDVQMWVVYPPNFTPDRKWPLYLLLHGGPHNGVTDGYQWRWNAQVFANWGYVTAWHNFHGSSGFGQAWTDSITKDWAELPVPGHDQGGRVVRSRSRGSTRIAWPPAAAATAAISPRCCSASRIRSRHWSRTPPCTTPTRSTASDCGAPKKRYGEFWEDFERFARNSPHMNAANFNTPTLVIHGQLDRRVPVNHGIELFNALQNRGVPSKFVYFPDENHWVLKPQNSLFWYETKRKWLEQYVTPGPVAAAAVPTSRTDIPIMSSQMRDDDHEPTRSDEGEDAAAAGLLCRRERCAATQAAQGADLRRHRLHRPALRPRAARGRPQAHAVQPRQAQSRAVPGRRDADRRPQRPESTCSRAATGTS